MERVARLYARRDIYIYRYIYANIKRCARNGLDTEAIHPRVRVTRTRSFRPALIANLNLLRHPLMSAPPPPPPPPTRRVIIDFAGDSTTVPPPSNRRPPLLPFSHAD